LEISYIISLHVAYYHQHKRHPNKPPPSYSEHKQPVLSLKPINTTSLLFFKNSTGSKYLNELNTRSYHAYRKGWSPCRLILKSTWLKTGFL